MFKEQYFQENLKRFLHVGHYLWKTKSQENRSIISWFTIVICFQGCNSREDIIATNLIKGAAFSPSPLLTFDVCLLVSDELILTMVACTTVGSVSLSCGEEDQSAVG